MGRIHEVLRWANRREVAREVTRRGYRVSGETLNRWVRDEAEFPAVVERIVFDLFTIGQTATAPPDWARRLAIRLRAHSYRLEVTDEDLARAEAEMLAEETVAAAELGPPAPGSGDGVGAANA